MNSVFLEDICDIQIGKTPPRSVSHYWNGSLPWATIRDFSDGRVITKTKNKITDEGARKSGSKMIPKGTLLLSFKLSLGKRAFSGCDMFTNEAIAALQPKGDKEVFPNYLYWYLGHVDYDRLVDRAAKGKTLNKEKLKRIKISLPPLDDQKRIAEILDKADRLRTKRQETIATLDALIHSTFFDMFSDCDRPPISIGDPAFGSSSCFTPLKNVARLATGHTPDRKETQYWDGDIPWVSLTDIRDLDGKRSSDTSQKITEKGVEKSSAVKLPAGTVCFSRTASVGYVTIMGCEMATSQDFVNWVCGEKINPDFLMWALKVSRPYLLSKTSGSTHKTIYYRHAERFQVFLPDMRRQKKFSLIADAIEQQKTRMRAQLAELDILFASLKHRAFTGEL